MFSNALRRARIRDAGCGRDDGWIVERQGEPIGLLVECRTEEMFWDSYRLVVITAERATRELMRRREFWDDWLQNEVVFRSIAFGETARFPFPAATPILDDGRILMRGLYLDVSSPSSWDKVLGWFRNRTPLPPP